MNLRVSYASIVAVRTTPITKFLSLKRLRTLAASPTNPPPDLLVSTSWAAVMDLVFGLRIGLVVIISRRLVLLDRVARTLLAAVMAALAADLLAAKSGLASVACTMNPLANGFPDKILASSPAGQGDNMLVFLVVLIVTVVFLILALVLLASKSSRIISKLICTRILY